MRPPKKKPRERVKHMYGILDLESSPNTGWVSQISFLKCVIDDTSNRTRVECAYVYLIDKVYDPDHPKTKRLLESVHEYGYKNIIQILPINKAIQDICRLTSKNRYIPIVSHALDRDIEALRRTDEELNGGFFERIKKPSKVVPAWFNIHWVCSQMILRDYCPVYWETLVHIRTPDGFKDCTLRAHVKLVLGREQKHVSLDDCKDLFDLLRIIFKTDGPRTRTHLFKNVKGVNGY